MSSIFAGSGLGVFGSSLTQANGYGADGNARIGNGRDQVRVNVVNGNLVVDAQDEVIHAYGLDDFLVRTYNSQGELEGYNDNNWRFSFDRSLNVGLLPQMLHGDIVRKTPDGYEQRFTWVSGDTWRSQVGPGAYDTLVGLGSTFEFREGGTGVVETYTSTGRLLSIRDQNGNTQTYNYDLLLMKVTSIVDSSGQTTFLDYGGLVAGSLTGIRVVGLVPGTTTGQTQEIMRVQFQYGGLLNANLLAVSVELTPGAAGFGDGQVYTTSYTYEAGSDRISTITQSDGSSLTVTYQMVGGQYRVKTLTDALGHTTQFTYDTGNNRTIVIDPLTNTTIYTYDGNGRLVSVELPATNGASSLIQYQYDANGNVSQVTDAAGRIVTYAYDANGNVTLIRDLLGNTVSRTYDADSRLTSETLYTTTNPVVGTTPGMTSRFAYDANKNVRFSVSPQGQVTEYRYDPIVRNERVTVIRYPAALYTGTDFSTAALTTWAAAQDQTKVQRTDSTYDGTGQIRSVTAWNATDAAGLGLNDGKQSVSRYVYDRMGRLLISVDPRGNSTTAGNAYVTSYVYDGLDRLVQLQDGTGRITTTQYDDANNRIITSLTGGVVSTTVKNRAGDTTSVTQASSSGTVLQRTTYDYDAADRLVRSTVYANASDTTGANTYYIYDARGRQVGVISPERELVETVYNADNQVIATIAYANAVTASLTDGTGAVLALAILPLRPLASDLDRTSRRYYDNAGELIYEIDAAGYATGYTYDGAGRQLSARRYATRLTTIPTSGLAGDVAVTANDAQDRITRFFYDNDGRTVATLDADGYLAQVEYDAAGEVRKTTAYANAAQAPVGQSLVTASLSVLQGWVAPNSALDQVTWTFYDGQGRVVTELDAGGYATTRGYDVAGNVTALTRYGTALTYSGSGAVTLPGSGSQRTTSYQYDALDRVTQSTDYQGTVTTNSYDARGFLVSSTEAAGQNDNLGRADARTTLRYYDDLGRQTNVVTGKGATQASPENFGTRSVYDLAGRLVKTTDPNGFSTLYYYDTDSRLRYTVNALGEVAENRYDAFGEVTTTRQYAQRIDTTNLLGGLLTQDSVFTTRVGTLSSAADRVSNFTYNTRGLLSTTTDAEQFTQVQLYGAFGEVVDVVADSGVTRGAAASAVTAANGALPAPAGSLYRIDHFAYDKRGNRTSTTQDVGGLNLAQSVVVDAFGRVTQRVDANGNITRTIYADPSGRVVTVRDALNQNSITTYDAFDRVISQQDRTGATTTYQYNDATQTVTLTTPEGIVQTTTTNRHGQTIRIVDGVGMATVYGYDADGNRTTEVTDTNGLQLTQTSTYDYAGLLQEVTDARGTITRYQYDAANRVLTRTVDPNGLALKTQYAYDALGQAYRTTDAKNVVTETVFDRNGRTTTVIVDTATLKIATRYTRDASGDAVLIEEGLQASGSSGSWTLAVMPETQTTQVTFDNANRRTSEIVDPGSGKLNLTTRYFYDGNGNVVRKLDANNQAWRSLYDANDRLVYTVDPTGALSENRYDAEGRITRTLRYATPINAATLTDSSKPSNVAPVVNAADRSTWQVFDRDGRVSYRIDATGGVIKNTYDGANRVTVATQYAARIVTTSLGNTPTKTTLDGLVNESNTANRRSYTVYDSAGRAAYTLDSLRDLTQTVYDGAGNVLYTRAYATPLGGSVALTKSAIDGALASLRSDTRDRVTAYVYDAAGRQRFSIRATSLSGTSLTGYVTETLYDAVGRVAENIRYQTAASLSSFTPTLSAVSTAVIGVTNPGLDQHDYNTYDGAGRLTLVIDAEGYTQKYTYDRVGNKKTYINQNNATWTYAYDAAGRLTDETTPNAGVTNVTAQTPVTGLVGATGSVVSSDSQFVYVTGTSTIGVFQRQTDGSLRSVQVLTAGSGGVGAFSNGATAALSGDGAYLYMLATGNGAQGDGTLTVFSRNATTGLLTFVQRLQDNAGGIDGLANPQNLSVIGNSIYVASAADNSVTLFTRGTNGQLTLTQRLTTTNNSNFAGAAAVAASADGVSVYALTTSGLVVMTRNASTGVMTYSTTVTVAFLPGLIGGTPTAVLVSPDGKSVYVAGQQDLQPTVYDRATTGALTLRSTRVAGPTGTVLRGMAISANGSTLSMLDGTTEVVTTYARDSVGALSGAARTLTVNAASARGMSLSADGAYAYVQLSDNSLVTYTRNGTGLGAMQRIAQGDVLQQVQTSSTATATRFTYDGLGNLKSRIENYQTTDPTKARVTTYDYDAAGRQIVTTTATKSQDGIYGSFAAGFSAGLSSYVTYNALGDAVVSLDVGNRSGYKVYDAAGRVSYEIDADGFVTNYGYNAFGDQTSVTRFANALRTGAFGSTPAHVGGVAYTAEEVVLRLLPDNGTGGRDRAITTTYDTVGRKALVVEPTVYAYDATSQTAATASPTTGFVYNAFGDVIRQTALSRPGVTVTTYSYYDQAGRKSAQVDAMGYLTEWQYSATDTQIGQKEWTDALAAGTWTETGYTAPTAIAAQLGEQQVTSQWQTTFAGGSTSGLSGTFGSNFVASNGLLQVKNATGGSGWVYVQGAAAQPYAGSDTNRVSVAFDFVTGILSNTRGEKRIGIGNWDGVTNTAGSGSVPPTFGFYASFTTDGYVTFVMLDAGRTVQTARFQPDQNEPYRIEFVTDARGVTAYFYRQSGSRASAYTYRFDSTNVPSFRTQIFANRAGSNSNESSLNITKITENFGDYATVSAASLTARRTANVRETQYGYNRLDRQTSVSQLGVISSTIAADGRIQSSIGTIATSTQYDGLGNVIAKTDAAGTTRWLYDALGRQIAKIGPQKDTLIPDGTTVAINSLETYTYDALGNQITQTNYVNGALNATQATPRRVNYLRDTTSISRVDILGRVIEAIDEEGQKSNYTYDQYGNVLQFSQSWSNVDGTTGQQLETYTYTARGQVLFRSERQTSGGTAYRNYTYNAFGEVVNEEVGSTDSFGVTDASLQIFRYDNAGRLILANPDGIDTVYLYDLQGRNTAQIVSPVDDLSTKVAGNTPSTAVGLANSRRTETVYDALGRAVTQRLPSLTQATSLATRYKLNVVDGSSSTPAKITLNNNTPVGAVMSLRLGTLTTNTWITLTPTLSSATAWTVDIPAVLSSGTYKYELTVSMPGDGTVVSTQSGTMLLQAPGMFGYTATPTGVTLTTSTIGGVPYLIFTPPAGSNLLNATTVDLSTASGTIRLSVRTGTDIGAGKLGTPVPNGGTITGFRLMGPAITSLQAILYPVSPSPTLTPTANSVAHGILTSLFQGALAEAAIATRDLRIGSLEVKPIGSGPNVAWTPITLAATGSLFTQNLNLDSFDFRVRVNTPTGTLADLSGVTVNGQALVGSDGYVSGSYRNDYSVYQTIDDTPTNQITQILTPVQSTQYDRWGNVTRTTDPTGVVVNYRYDESNRLIETLNSIAAVVTDRGTTYLKAATFETAYDSAGRAIAGVDGNGNLTTQRYDAAGNLISQADGMGAITRYAYDALNRRVQQTDALGAITSYGYDRASRLTIEKSAAKVTADIYLYDSLGNRTGSNRGQASYVYDAWGRIIKQLQPATSGSTPRTTTYQYDNLGRQTRLTDALGNYETWTYDSYRLRSHTSLSGKANASDTVTVIGDPTTYGYDYAGQKTEEVLTVSGKNYVRRYSYYANGQLKSVYDPGPTPNPGGIYYLEKLAEYRYDEAGRTTAESLTARRRNISSSTSSGYTWNTLHNSIYRYSPTGKLFLVNDNVAAAQYAFDAQGNRKYTTGSYLNPGSNFSTYPLSTTLYRYDYDANNRVINETQLEYEASSGGSVIGHDLQAIWLRYDAAGNRIQEDTYAIDLFGASITTLKDVANKAATNVYEALDDATLASLRKSENRNYYDANRRATTTWSSTGGVHDYSYVNWTYNDADQVAKQQYNNGSITAEYTYNGDGSISSIYQYGGSGYTDNRATYTYDAAGNVTNQETRRTSNNNFISSYTYTYALGESGYLQRLITANANGGTTNTNTYYNYRDEINYTSSPDGSYAYTYDLNGQIINKSAINNINEREQQVFVGGTLIGSKRTDPNGAITMNFGFDYTPISKAYPNITPGQYVVRAGDTLQSISQAVYGDASRWYVIADANNLSSTSALPENLSLKIPNTVTNASNTSETFRPYSPGDVIGDLTPSLPKPRKKHSKTFTTILVAVVAVVATVYSAGVAASAFGATGSTFGVGTAALSGGTAGALTSGVAVTTGQAVAGALVGGAFGSIASQGVAIGLGLQDNFSFSQVAIGALGAAATAGIGAGLNSAQLGVAQLGENAAFGELAKRGALQGVLNGVAQNGIGTFVGTQSHFKWSSIAAGAVTSGIAAGGGFNAANPFENIESQSFNLQSLAFQTTAGFLANTARQAITIALQGHGKIDVVSIAADSFGNALGNSIVGALQQADFDKRLGNLSGGAKQAYDNVLERGYTPQQALVYAQDYQGIESPISRMDAGAPRMSALTANDLAVDLNGIVDNAASMSLNIAPATVVANRDVAALNAMQAPATAQPTFDAAFDNDSVRDIAGRYLNLRRAELAEFRGKPMQQAAFTNSQYSTVALSDDSAPWFFTGEQVSQSVTTSFWGINDDGPLGQVFQDINKEIYVDAMGFRDIYNDFGIEGVRQVGELVYPGQADSLINAYSQIDSIKKIAAATGATFREAASSVEGLPLLRSAVGSFFQHEQGVVAESIYQRPRPELGGMTGAQIVERDFDNSRLMQIGAWAFGDVQLASQSVSFSGNLSNLTDRLRFAGNLTSAFVSAYTSPREYGLLRNQVFSPSALNNAYRNTGPR